MKKYSLLTTIIEVIILIFIVVCIVLLFNPLRIKILNKSYNNKSTYLDFSNINASNVDNYIDNIDYFHNLKEINFGNQILSYKDKEKLIKRYPNIKFDVISIVELYGLKLKDNIEYLDLSNIEIDDNLDYYLSIFQNLKEVNFGNNDISRDNQLYLVKKYPNIVFNWNIKLLDYKYNSNIEALDLSNKTIMDLDDFYSSLKLFNNLKKIDMSNTNLTNEELGNMRKKFSNIKIDWIIHLGRWNFRTDAKAFSVLITNYDYVRLTSDDIEVFKYCTDLEALDLGHQKITTIDNLISYLPNLRILILADNKISNISAISKLKKLQYIELFMNKITDVSPLNECKELLDVNVCYNKIENINTLLDLPKLERLWIVNTRTSSDNLELLKRNYPNVNIVTVGSGSTDSGWRTHERYHAMIDMYHKNYISEVFTKYDN